MHYNLKYFNYCRCLTVTKNQYAEHIPYAVHIAMSYKNSTSLGNEDNVKSPLSIKTAANFGVVWLSVESISTSLLLLWISSNLKLTIRSNRSCGLTSQIRCVPKQWHNDTTSGLLTKQRTLERNIGSFA